jgi:hypothetical protein
MGAVNEQHHRQSGRAKPPHLALIANIVGLSGDSVPITIASFALLLAAFGRIAVIVRSSPAWPQSDTPVTTRPAPSALPARN